MMDTTTYIGPKFHPGNIVMTQGVMQLIEDMGEDQVGLNQYLARHLSGDWGDLCEEDRELNDQSVTSGGRLLSSYKVKPGVAIWVITEWDRSVTTFLLPSEY